MPGIVYFLEGRQSVSARELRKKGLGYLLEGDSLAKVQAPEGPGAKGGVIFSTSASSLAEAGSVEWKRYVGREDLWVGLLPGGLPKPEDFYRSKPLDGYWVELGDGQSWAIPVARAVTGATPLPRRLEYGPGGWVHGEVIEAHRELFAHACRVWDAIVSAEGEDAAEIGFEDEIGIACMAITANYRLGPVEISLLGLMTTEVEKQVLLHLVDWPAVEELSKNAAAGELSLELGPEASSPATPQRSQSSS